MRPRPFDDEGPECEWKERLPRPERLARTLAAFANGVGGSLWVGVTDAGEVVGSSDTGSGSTDIFLYTDADLDGDGNPEGMVSVTAGIVNPPPTDPSWPDALRPSGINNLGEICGKDLVSGKVFILRPILP